MVSFKTLVSLVVLLLASGLGSAFAQTLPNIRTTFVPRLPEPADCDFLGCCGQPSYDGSTLAAIGAADPVVYVYRRIPAGPWYAQATLHNNSAMKNGLTTSRISSIP